MRLRRDRRSQYVLLFPDNSNAETATLHRVSQGRYIVAVAHEESAGEDLYLATLSANGASFRLYAPGVAPNAAALAAKTGAQLTHPQFADDLSGPLASQRAFAIAMTADLGRTCGWRPIAGRST